jgi:hypothetical protein
MNVTKFIITSELSQRLNDLPGSEVEGVIKLEKNWEDLKPETCDTLFLVGIDYADCHAWLSLETGKGTNDDIISKFDRVCVLHSPLFWPKNALCEWLANYRDMANQPIPFPVQKEDLNFDLIFSPVLFDYLYEIEADEVLGCFMTVTADAENLAEIFYYPDIEMRPDKNFFAVDKYAIYCHGLYADLYGPSINLGDCDTTLNPLFSDQVIGELYSLLKQVKEFKREVNDQGNVTPLESSRVHKIVSDKVNDLLESLLDRTPSWLAFEQAAKGAPCRNSPNETDDPWYFMPWEYNGIALVFEEVDGQEDLSVTLEPVDKNNKQHVATMRELTKNVINKSLTISLYQETTPLITATVHVYGDGLCAKGTAEVKYREPSLPSLSAELKLKKHPNVRLKTDPDNTGE